MRFRSSGAALPDDLIGSLPSVEDLEAELAPNGGTDTEDEY